MNAYKILLLEDNESDYRFIERILKKENNPSMELKRVALLQDALDLLQMEYFDIILSDLFVPSSNGLDTLKSLLEKKGLPSIIVLTGMDDERMGREALRLGADDYLVKDETIESRLGRSIYFSMMRSHR